ncbi:MAG: SPFH domain-containing protein [Rubinisphaera brasiliensis]|uniref:SPFH domain-containing protein n=1 Tax=Rubinisphaera brasiliensis TaxID=119 RepID=UPI00391D6E47
MAGGYDSDVKDFKAMAYGVGGICLLIMAVSLFSWLALTFFRVDVPTAKMAILIKKTGEDLNNSQEVAPSEEYKGVQAKYLLEGKHWLDPYNWEWEVIDQQEVPHGKMGVLVSLTGDDLGYGEFLAHVKPGVDKLDGGVETKGIVPDVLREGRYPIHPYLFSLQIHDPIVVPAGYKGVLTNLAGPIPDDPNTLLVEKGMRGVQEEVLEPGTYYLNPYQYRVDLVDCRSQTLNLAENKDMGFPSKDGFWITLDGTIEFRVDPEKVAEVFVTYNDQDNGSQIGEEITRKIIMPVARSYCRVEGSKTSGREFIAGDSRAEFETKFEDVIRAECEPLGIEVVQALIRNIQPPQQIAGPVRDRELAKQDQTKFRQQILQQQEEIATAIEREMVKRKQAIVKADQDVVKMTTEALREQEVAVTKANERLEVAKLKVQAAKDEAEAIRARGKAEADVITFNNEAEAAGWKQSVAAFSGDGNAFARYLLHQKLAPAYRNIMANTDNSPIMRIFETFAPDNSAAPSPPSTQPANTSAASTATTP